MKKLNFLFEIGLEELPSRYVDEAESNLKKIAEKELKEEIDLTLPVDSDTRKYTSNTTNYR